MCLQKAFNWLAFWKLFLDANVARTLKKLPSQLDCRRYMSALDLDRMKNYACPTEELFANSSHLTDVGLIRSGCVAGRGFNPTRQRQN
jgi:hypothetical protein